MFRESSELYLRVQDGMVHTFVEYYLRGLESISYVFKIYYRLKSLLLYV